MIAQTRTLHAIVRLAGPALAAALLLASGCGSSTRESSAPVASSRPPSRASSTAPNLDWPLFGLNAQRTNADGAATGITGNNARRLRRRIVALPGTVDSSPIYLHAVRVSGALRDVFVMTTTYGKTLAVDAASGRILWVFTPSSYGSYAGTYQITTSSPAADPDRRHVFAAAPDGSIYRLSLADGQEQAGAGWPVSITRLPRREKITAAINIDGSSVIASTGGYVGDTPPYQGHVVVIGRESGSIINVFNTLCANVHRLMTPTECPQSDSAVWARDGVQVEPNGNLLFATGNGYADDNAYLGNSVLEISPAASHLLAYWTPPNANTLSKADKDVGSTGPVLTGRGTIVQSGKDGKLHVIVLGNPGHEIQTLTAPGGSEMNAGVPAVWRRGGRTTIYLATDTGGTAAYEVTKDGRLALVWMNGTGGTSPIIAGGLLYVYDPAGGLVIYAPADGRVIVRLPAGAGHWNAPVIGGGRVALPQGNANDHKRSGILNLYALP
jgi:PQQ-like domain